MYYGTASFYLAAVYSPDSELSADGQFPRPRTLKKSPLSESHCAVSARASCRGNPSSPGGCSMGIRPECRLDVRAFFFLDFRDNRGVSGFL